VQMDVGYYALMQITLTVAVSNSSFIRFASARLPRARILPRLVCLQTVLALVSTTIEMTDDIATSTWTSGA
jgi:hypothetical protein